MPSTLTHALHTHYRWLIVAAGGLLGCVAIGGLFALPVLLRPIAQDTGWSTTGISTAMTLAFIAMALGSVAWGNLSDRIGPRPVVLTGAVLLAAGLWLASLAPSLLAFQVCFGVVVGLAASAVFPPLMACVTGWFDTHRSLAVSLVSAGMGMAPMTMSPLVAWLVQTHDWRSTLQIVAAIVAGLMVPAALLIRRPPALEQAAAPDAAAASPASAGQVLRSAPFLILTLMSFLSCATHSGPIFHTVSYAVTCGIPLMVAVSIYSLEGVSGMVGRLVFGLLGDRFGAARVLTLALLAQAVVALGYAAARELGSFYTVAALFGFTYAGVMPLFAVIARENFPLHLMGTVIGGTATASSLGMALGPVAGGLIYDAYTSYVGLFVGAFALGLGAFLAAVVFVRSASKREALASTGVGDRQRQQRGRRAALGALAVASSAATHQNSRGGAVASSRSLGLQLKEPAPSHGSGLSEATGPTPTGPRRSDGMAAKGLGNKLVLVRNFMCKPETLWDFWTVPALMHTWFGSDPRGTVEHAAADPRVGGGFSVTFQNSDGASYTCGGRYLDVQRPHALSFTWYWAGREDHAERISLKLSDDADGARMEFLHEDIDAETTHNYEAGWDSTFEKLRRAIERHGPNSAAP